MTILHTSRRLSLGFTVAIGLLALVYVCPNPAFAYTHSYGGFIVRSDRPIAPAIDHVLDDATRRLKTSPLHHDGEEFRLFICNDRWRLGFFVLNTSLGGGTVFGTRNIFLREADIGSNRIISPSGGPLLDEKDRPMSYFIAHEATHVMELRRYGELAMIRSPSWLFEGYADLVAKAGNFDVANNRELLNNHDNLLSDSSGLYRRYHLMVLAQLGSPGVTLDRLFEKPPSEREALQAARSP